MENDKIIVPAAGKSLHGIFYTDGGANPNPGKGGWGVYGQIYSVDEKLKCIGPTSKKTVDVFDITDTTNKVKLKPLEFECREGKHFTTNNVMEMSALLRALQFAIDTGLKSAYIYSDSQYAINGLLKFAPGWQKNNWRRVNGEPPANVELWKIIKKAYDRTKELGIATWFEWVKGHSGVVGNERADVLATKGIADARVENYKENFEVIVTPNNVDIVELSVGKKEKIVVPKANRIIGYPKWYFIANLPPAMSVDGRHIYYTSTHGKDKELDLLGKDMSDCGFSVAFTKEPVDTLERIRKMQERIIPSDNRYFILGRLDNLLSGNGASEFAKDGFSYMEEPTRNCYDLATLSGKLYTTVINPPRRALFAMSSIDSIKRKLDQYVKDSNTMQVVEVTDKVYKVSKGKGSSKRCKLLTSLIGSVKSIVLPTKYDLLGTVGTADVNFTIGEDLPSRNTLSALAVRGPSIYTITWKESDSGFRYATIVDCGDDISIWCSIHANLFTIEKG